MKKIMQRATGSVLAIAYLFTLTGCSNQDYSSETPTDMEESHESDSVFIPESGSEYFSLGGKSVECTDEYYDIPQGQDFVGFRVIYTDSSQSNVDSIQCEWADLSAPPNELGPEDFAPDPYEDAGDYEY